MIDRPDVVIRGIREISPRPLPTRASNIRSHRLLSNSGEDARGQPGPATGGDDEKYEWPSSRAVRTYVCRDRVCVLDAFFTVSATEERREPLLTAVRISVEPTITTTRRAS